jgi:2-octaprenyl-6-methoxyphenol hydroxylase
MTEICINGAGPVGAALACRLAASGWRVLVVDRAGLAEAEDPSLDGRAYAIAEGARRMLEAAGVWQHLGAIPQPITEIRVADGRPGERPSTLGLQFASDDRPSDDVPFGWMIEARDLRTALNAALRTQPLITVAAPDQARFSFGRDGVSVALNSGATHEVRLAIAAEGRRSPLREQAGIAVTRIPYHQCGLVAMIGHERPHDGTALEQFLPQGPFARLPMRGTDAHPNRSAIVWAESEIRARRYYDLPDAAFAAEIAERLRAEDIGAITMAGRRWIYPLSAQYAHSYIADRMALVGDSAHGIHPIAGQGLNLGFRDVIALARTLGEARGQDPGSRDCLMRYQRATRPGNLAMLAATDGLERLFGNDNPVLRLGRDLGMAAVNRLPRLRRAFARRAMGL